MLISECKQWVEWDVAWNGKRLNCAKSRRHLLRTFRVAIQNGSYPRCILFCRIRVPAHRHVKSLRTELNWTNWYNRIGGGAWHRLWMGHINTRACKPALFALNRVWITNTCTLIRLASFVWVCSMWRTDDWWIFYLALASTRVFCSAHIAHKN